MKLDFGNLNSQFISAPNLKGQETKALRKNSNPLNFKGAIDGISSDIIRVTQKEAGSIGSNIVSSNAGSRIANFLKENITEGTESRYANPEHIFDALRKNFGSTFDDCRAQVEQFAQATGCKNPPISFAEDGSLIVKRDPFAKNVAQGFKEFTLGTILDIGVGIRQAFRKLTGSGAQAESTGSEGFISRILNNRVKELDARESFYKLAGVLEQVTDKSALAKLSGTESERLAQRAENLAADSVKSATKKVGNYNTKSERAWNRMGTGFVSAVFAGTDFYNISMLQNDDKEKARQAGRQRFFQDMRRQLITASLTFVVLGAFQKKVNNSIPYAVLSLGGVTLLSEITSRLIGGISLTPLSPEEAKKMAEKRGYKQTKETLNNETKTSSVISPQKSSVDNVFNIFTDKYANKPQELTFTSNSIPKKQNIENTNINTNSNETSNKANNLTENSKEEKKTPLYKKILGGVGAVIAASLGIGLLRSKNVMGIDTALKKLSSSYKDFTDGMTTRKLVMSKSEVDNFIQHLRQNNLTQQADSIVEKLKLSENTLESTSDVVKKFYKGTVKEGEKYYDLGHVDAKGRKIVYDVLTYPISLMGKITEKADNLVRALFGAQSGKSELTSIQKNIPLTEMVEKYTEKLSKIGDGDKSSLNKEIQNAFTRHFSETSSKNKNTSIAMLSRFLITLISGYFFVNDYRNEVLIESQGKDIDRANATMKERIGHKVSNFVLNSMFMDLFNSTFERAYLGSVPGATLVAMATEFTNETAVRASICTPSTKMTRDELIEYEKERLNDTGLKGKYYRSFMKLTGKKPLSEKASKKNNNKEEQRAAVKAPVIQGTTAQNKLSMQEFIKTNKV